MNEDGTMPAGDETTTPTEGTTEGSCSGGAA
jgi:hypothetical protein